MKGPESSLEVRPLLDLHLIVPAVDAIGRERRVAVVTGGEFAGERLRGTVLPGGNDWITVRSDGTVLLDARGVLKTDDGALIAVSWSGMRHGPADVMERLAEGAEVDPSEYYFRSTFSFETSDERYAWLSRIIAPATGRREVDGVFYSVFQLL